MKLNQAQLEKVLKSVTDDVTEMLKSEAEDGVKLSKTDPGEESPAEKTPEGSSTDTAPEASAEGSAPPPAAEGSAPPPAEGSAPADPSAGGDPAADAAATPEALQAEYAKLQPEQLKVHFLACKAALMAVLGAGDPAAAGGGDPSAMGADAGAPPAAGPEGSASPDAPPPPAMGKGEFDDKSGKVTAGKMSKSLNGDLEIRLAKAEQAIAQVEALTKTVAEKDATIMALQENVNRIAAGVTKLMDKQASMRKSYSGVGFVAKPGSEPMAKSEAEISTLTDSQVNEKLREVTASESLAKSDRDLINNFYAGNRKDRSKVAKFLTVA